MSLALCSALLALAASAAISPSIADDRPKKDNVPPTYYWVLLESGPSKVPMTPQERADMQKAHIGNLTRLADEGTNRLAGPLGTSGHIRGIAVLALDGRDQLEESFKPDPFVQKGYLSLRVFDWTLSYGSIRKYQAPPDMAEVCFALVRRDPNLEAEIAVELFAELQEEFIDHERELTATAANGVSENAKETSLAVAGPLAQSGEYCGLLLFRNNDRARLLQQLEQTTHVESGDLVIEFHPVWLDRKLLAAKEP